MTPISNEYEAEKTNNQVETERLPRRKRRVMARRFAGRVEGERKIMNFNEWSGASLMALGLALAGCGGAGDDAPGSLEQVSSALDSNNFTQWTSIGSPIAAGVSAALFGTAAEFQDPQTIGTPRTVYTVGADLHMHSLSGFLGTGWSPVDSSRAFAARPAVVTWTGDDNRGFALHHTVIGIGLGDHGLWTNSNFNVGVEFFAGWSPIGVDTFCPASISDALVSQDDLGPSIALGGGNTLVACAINNADNCTTNTGYRVSCATNSDISNGFPSASWSAFQVVPTTGLPADVTVSMGVSAGTLGRDTVRIAIRGSDNDYYATEATAPFVQVTWRPWTKLNLGAFSSEPSLTSGGGGTDIFGLADAGQNTSQHVFVVRESTLPGVLGSAAAISQISSSGGPSNGFVSSAAAARGLSGSGIRVDATAIGSDGQVYVITWTGTLNQTTLAFEDSTLWSSPQVTPLSSANRKTQGDFGLSVPGSGYRVVNSHALKTPLAALTSTLALDVYVPANQPNPQWLGAVQTYASCPSAGINNAYLGQVELTGKPTNAFSRLSYAVPPAVKTALGQARTDCFFSIAVNTNQTPVAPVLDNLRFVP